MLSCKTGQMACCKEEEDAGNDGLSGYGFPNLNSDNEVNLLGLVCFLLL